MTNLAETAGIQARRQRVNIAEYGSVQALQAGKGTKTGPSEWLAVNQDRIDAFAAATDDHQWIHVDPERARSGPFGTTIAHGFLTLSLVPYFVATLRRLTSTRMTVNYGLDRVRFPAPVPVGSRLRARTMIISVDPLGESSAQVVTRVTIEIENGPKPACVAETVSRIYFES